MSKFFAQVMLSVVMGLSAAAGFSPDVRGAVSEVVVGTRTLVQSAFDTAANVDLDVEASADTEAGGDLNLVLEDVSNALPDASLNGSVSAETDVEVQSDDAGLDLESTLDALLGLGLGIGE